MATILTIEEIKKYINEDRTSKKKRQARVGLDYYELKNDIKSYRIFFTNQNGDLTEDKNALQIRACSGFFKELIEQKAEYSLSTKKQIVDSDNAELKSILGEYFNDEFNAELADLVRYGAIYGFSYIYAYQDKNDRKAFKFADGLNVVEVDGKYTLDKKDYIILYYNDKLLTVGENKDKEVVKIQVWDKEKVTYYLMVAEDIILDGAEPVNPRPHIIYNEGNNTYYDTFNFIPFFRYDNNKKQTSDLYNVKDYIDDYDLMNYGLGDNLERLSDGYICVKGFQGDNLDELVENVRNKKFIGVGEGGDLDIKTVNIPYEARKVKMEQDEKDIYRFGMGLNTASLAEGSYTNNVNIKTRYALLEMKCKAVERNLKKVLNEIVEVVLEEINKQHKTGYTLKDIYYNLDKRETITNELDNASIEKSKADAEQVKINTLLNIRSLLGNELTIQNICEVLDVDYEAIKDKLPEVIEEDADDIIKDLEAPTTEEQEKIM